MMECNKEEASRAMELAKKKMQQQDFVGALKFAEKARRLHPELENISQLITVCEVHCSSLIRIGGKENDWYKILNINPTVDEATIKKHYRKLALQLHPDKNKFAGAEAAFKLICEANRVLSDQANRIPYDRKYRDLARSVPSKTQANGRTQYGVNDIFRPRYNVPTEVESGKFWTSCPFCSTRYQYFVSCMNLVLACQNCHREFVGHNIGPSYSLNQQNIPMPKQMPQTEKAKSPRKRASMPSKAPKPKPEFPNAAKVNMENGDVKAEAQGTGKSKPDTPKPEKPESSKAVPNKRGRKRTVQSSDSEEFEEKGNRSSQPNGHNQRRSTRQKQNVSYQEFLGEDDDLGNKRKQSSTVEDSSFSESKEEQMSDHHEEKSETDTSSESTSNEEPVSESFLYPDPEFHDFDEDKKASSFAIGQVWATFESEESLPRYYAYIKTVVYSQSKLNITWLEAFPDKPNLIDWCDAGLPAACGRFDFGNNEKVNFDMCSHQVQHIGVKFKNKKIFLVYPRKGETWAIFQNWDIQWSSDPAKHKPFKYDYVEILSDFDKDSGGIVAYLERVKGFVSLFQRNRVQSFRIPPTDIYRFSHQVPSHQMTGKERQGVPEGSFEFDPVSLPSYFFDGNDLDDDESVKGDEASVSDEKVPLPRKSPRKVGNDASKNLNDSKRSATAPQSQTNEKFSSPKKPESKLESEALNLRRSPRDANKNKGEAANRGSAKEEKSTKESNLDKSPIGQLFRKYAPGDSDIPKSPGESSVKSLPPGNFDFSKLKSKESFEVNQIWAMRTNGDLFPKTYGQINRISLTPEFRVFVKLLDRSSSAKGSKDPVSCGIFKVKDDRPIAFPLSNFSHCVSAVPENNKHSFSIYPRKGEIWALYKSHNSDSTCPNPSKGECDIVEVVDEGKKGRKVVVLSRDAGSKTLFSATRLQRSKSSVEIPNAETARFSHQIPAVKHDSCWELDQASTPEV